MKIDIHAKYDKKIWWILYKQYNKDNKTQVKLEDVAVIVGDISIPQPVEDLLKNGSIVQDGLTICDLAPQIDWMIEGH